uniref:Transcription factor MYB98 (Trinotate prediction) n=1 Tax=Henneguya salminicola TaxID=69463 RepID=A0A6G3MGH3_HENSL
MNNILSLYSNCSIEPLSKELTVSQLSLRKYTKNEDKKILECASKYGKCCWFQVFHLFKDRSPRHLRRRYLALCSINSVYNLWSDAKDLKLIELVQEFEENWEDISNKMPETTPNACQKRYNYLKNQRVISKTFY